MSGRSPTPPETGELKWYGRPLKHERLALLGLTALALASEGLYASLIRLNAIDGLRPVATFVGVMLTLFVLYGVAFLILRRLHSKIRSAALIVVLAAICFRITMLPAGLPPDASSAELVELARADLRGEAVSFDRYLLYDDDIWRYLWDGHVSANSVNPSRYAPADRNADFLAAPAAGPTRAPDPWEDIRDNVNHAWIPTIYPPLAQGIFRLSHAIAPGSVLALKAILTALDLLTILLVWLGLRKLEADPAWLLLYAWNPLLIKVVAGSGHVDVLAGTMLALTAWFLLIRAHLPAAIALAAASLTKLAPILLLPFLAKRIGWRKALIVPVVVVAAYLPFSGSGSPVFSGLRLFAMDWQFNSAFFLLTHSLASTFSSNPSLVARALGVLAICASMVWLWRRDDGQAASFPLIASHMLAAVILFSPTVMPWYLVWLLPLAVLSRTTIWVWLTGLVCLAFFVMVDGTQRTSVVALEYGAFIVIALATLRRQARQHTRPLGQERETTKTARTPTFAAAEAVVRQLSE